MKWSRMSSAMLTIKLTNKFKKDLARAERRGYNIELLNNVVQLIANGQITEKEAESLRKFLQQANAIFKI